MVKRKPRQVVLPIEKNCVSPQGMTLSGEDDWVIVKKQKITILIPPLHASEPEVTNADLCTNKIDATPTNSERHLQLPNTTDGPKNALCGKAGHISPHPESSTQVPKTATIEERDPEKGKHPSINIQRIPSKNDKFLEVQDTQRPLKQPRRLLIGPTAAIDGGVFLNQMMRASNLDKKIRRAGGLSNWLESLGLHQFVALFNRRRVDRFQLVNLTMKKLKDMGATAVGPRRKLMHAIDCLCQPYCFQSRRIAALHH